VGVERSDGDATTVVSTVAIPTSTVVTVAASDAEPTCVVKAYVSHDATGAEVEELTRRLLAMRAGQRIRSFEYVSPEAARERMVERLGEDSPILELALGNPLPASFEVMVRPGTAADVARELAEAPGLQPDRPGQPNPDFAAARLPGEPDC
jgi:cell division protein FtsX